MYNKSRVYSPVCVPLKFWSCTWYFLQCRIYCHTCNKLPFKQTQKRKAAPAFTTVLEMQELRRVPLSLRSTVFNPNPISPGISSSKKIQFKKLKWGSAKAVSWFNWNSCTELLTAVLWYTLARRNSPQYRDEAYLVCKRSLPYWVTESLT